MNKTDKELTTEIVIALINANHRIVGANGVIKDAMSGASVINMINNVYEALSNLDKSVDKQ